MNEKYGKKHQKLSMDEKFNFSCHKGLSCFNTCCNDVNIFLTPYDVLRMRRGIGLSSKEFLESYTIALLGEEGLPLVVLKMIEDENKNCPFVLSDGCGIYQDRPWSCRMYPVFPASSERRLNNQRSSKEEEFFIEENPSCLGLKEEKQWIIQEWKKDQGIDIYDKMNELYQAVTFHDYFQKGNKLDREKAMMLYNACYDLDEFMKFLFETKFFDIYDVDKEVFEKIKKDEEELLSFGYRWLRFNLFSEDILKLKDKEMDKIMQAKREELS